MSRKEGLETIPFKNMKPAQFPSSFGLTSLDQQQVSIDLAKETAALYKLSGDGNNIFAQSQNAAQEIEMLRNVNKKWKALAQQFMQETLEDAMDTNDS